MKFVARTREFARLWCRPRRRPVTAGALIVGLTVLSLGLCGFVATESRPETGLLRVVGSPGEASDLEVRVDGLSIDDWSHHWLRVLPGQRTVLLSDARGFSISPPIVAEVRANSVTAVTGDVEPVGNLRVVTSPAVPSTITIDGIPRDEWGLWTNLPVGAHQICFGKVAGFEAPPCQVVNVSIEQTTTIRGAFAPRPEAEGPDSSYGRLRVETEPAVPSQIRVDGVPINDWAVAGLKLRPGTYEVTFGGVRNFASPPPVVVVVESGTTVSVIGRFAPRGSLRVITDPPAAGSIVVKGIALGRWGIWLSADAGTYEICFGPAPGHSREPGCQLGTVSPGQSAVVTATYSP